MLRRHSRYSTAHSTYFVTTTIVERGNWLVNEDVCMRALDIIEHYRKFYQLQFIGYCLMPDHVHFLIHQEREGRDVSDFMERFKSISARSCVPPHYPPEQKFWRRRFDSMSIPGTRALQTKLRYIHWNPVRKGLVTEPQIYSWSSARDWYNGQQTGPVTICFETGVV